MATELSIDDEISDDLAAWRSQRLTSLAKGEASVADRMEAVMEFDSIIKRQKAQADLRRALRGAERRGITPHTTSVIKTAFGIRN